MSKENIVKRSVAGEIRRFYDTQTLKKPQFAKPLSKVLMEALDKGPVALNTDNSTMWTVTTFKMWHD